MGIKIGGQIEKVNGRELSYSEFAERYLAKNQPVVLTGLMDDWGACKDWVSSNGQPNLHFFSTHFGKSKVQVADCGTREFTDQKRVEMSVLEFVNHWLQGSVEDLDGNGNGKSVLYLKDWHFVKDPGHLFMLMFSDHIVGQPTCVARRSGFFCLLCNAIFCLTGMHNFLRYVLLDRNMKSSVYNIFDDISETKFSGFKKAIWMECIQEQNEIIFVPSGWYHQVHNLEDTISINHNWFNAYNLSWVWDLLLRDYKEAKEYIEDIKDICDNFEGLCQRNLAANTGMNFNDFFIFISRFSLANVVELYYIHNESKSKSSNRHWSDMVQHFAQNLASMRKIALKMKSEGGVQGNLGILDLRESLSDPKFLKLCSGLGRIYAVIHEQENWSCTMRKVLMAEFENYGSRVCSPEDLVKFIDYAVSKLSGNGTEQNTLLSVLYDAQPRQQN
ncbi:PREDICTED: jmjC domain-containing protein 4 isoform X2 [Theobroma cacao]|uniref:JmjC domain-containing protein 4 isoform X2 n=1 Tax=Theobroma cacao TaxID=3641 RepID=A0AB32W3Q0_THECC|nr:PREDICTED: jmjC domain-containing protein 4 isoform X2 [Theobroma cacao]